MTDNKAALDALDRVISGGMMSPHEIKKYAPLFRAALQRPEPHVCNDDRFDRVMNLLACLKMEHGLCDPRERRACTNCNAIDDLNTMLAEYKGPHVIPSSVLEQPTPAQKGEE